MWLRPAIMTAAMGLAASPAQAQVSGQAGLASELSRWRAGPLQTDLAAPAEAGAELRLGPLPPDGDRLRLGPVRRDGGSGAEGRWFLFAGARSSELGDAGRESAPGRASWADERAAASMTRAEAGIAVRKGDAQAAFGYVRRKLKVSGPQSDLLADMPKSDHVAGFSFSWTLR